MAASKIEWTEETWNPITGCTKYSDGCKNCYAERFANRLQSMGNARYKNAFKVTVHHDLFTKPFEWRTSKMVFVNSMSDLFHEDVSDQDILSLFDVMNKANMHTFQVLTKRADRLARLSKEIKWTDNIWMGVSIENMNVIDRRDKLVSTGAKIKFISAEPLLGSLSEINLDGIDWLIVGGEAGPGCRPMKKEWVIELRDKAEESETAFFFKQWGGTRKKKAGSELEGKYYKQYPKSLDQDR